MEIGVGSPILSSLPNIFSSTLSNLRLVPSSCILILCWTKDNIVEIRNSYGEWWIPLVPRRLVHAAISFPILIQLFSKRAIIIFLQTQSSQWSLCVLGAPQKTYPEMFIFFPWPAPWADIYFRLNLVFHMLIISFWHQITFLCFLMAEVSSDVSSISLGFPSEDIQFIFNPCRHGLLA